MLDIKLSQDKTVSSIVQLYLDSVCYRKIKYSQILQLEKLESRADCIEKKLIRTLKSMVIQNNIKIILENQQ